MSAADFLKGIPIDTLCKSSLSIDPAAIDTLLNKPSMTISDLPGLLGNMTAEQLEILAQKSHALTKQRFGNTMQLFIPMYLSNECFNTCTYCGFSIDNRYPRVTLTDDDITHEATILSKKGFKHVLLLTGEAPGKVDHEYIANAVRLVKPYFSSVGIEVQPLSHSEYTTIIDAGADSLTLYQETYHPDAYATYHLRGKKKHYEKRLDASDAGGKANFYRFNLGALLGLYDWRYDAIALAYHIYYMQKTYWKSHYSVSFPRINDMIGEFSVKYPVSDKELLQLICAFRLIFPDIGITLSTRESAELRNHLIKVGVTTISAESHTEPGGYSGKDAEKQFEISDTRSISEIQALLKLNGYDPVVTNHL